jgi:chromosome segregation ATPase
MARGGVNKAVVHKARQALLARGEHPSIDAVRIEMGNTGSKTTIHRYLKELDSDHPGHDSPQISVDDELLQLVSHLSQRIQEQGQARIDEALSRLEARERLMREALAQAERQLEELATQHSRQTTELQQQSSALLATRDALHAQQTENARLSQACQDLDTRLQDRDAQIRSLEEKHLHARDALEHYRSAVKEQREQEQRRHEGQVQQLQMELRQAQQSASIRQDEITQLNRDNERLLIEARNTRREHDELGDQLQKSEIRIGQLSERSQQAHQQCALMEVRLSTSQRENDQLGQQLTEQRQQNRLLELLLAKAEVTMENLRVSQVNDTPKPES